MKDSQSSTTVPPPPKAARGRWRRVIWRSVGALTLLALCISLVMNWMLYEQTQDYFAATEPPHERFHSGDVDSDERILLLRVRGTIMPPFTEQIRRRIKRASEDERIKGILLSIDSPGGLVADSHQIYHDLTKLREEKPVFVSMRRIAASGGYYIAMGSGPEGRIFAEPTTWTGSIGVILPRYDISEFAREHGIKSDSLTTGKFKETLSPLKELKPEERELWDTILGESFQRFKQVIADNRPDLSMDDVAVHATGQIFTASQAVERGLVDEIAFEEEAIEKLKSHLGLEEARVVTYEFTPSWYEVLTGYLSAQSKASPWEQLMEASVPRALYYCSWSPLVPDQRAD